MAILKCKMCGGDLNLIEGAITAECDYCGSVQTLPKANEDVIQNLFNRANTLRMKCEFDKAEQIYEKILLEDDTESEAHWGIVLCKYGIEYVEDPKTYKRIPTCHRTSYDAVTADADYLAAIEYADVTRRGIYEVEAQAIDAVQKSILSIVKEEKPFDVFICYKETDEDGKRTTDSIISNDIYYQLTQEGFKVFYAPITLEDKVGEYEPYIFAALNSAKVMLVIGTKPQYFSGVWVKNEWSRFLKRMKADRSKQLIPCYKDMEIDDLPEEFAHLQAQNMAKIGFINDVVRGIKKVIVTDKPKVAAVKEIVTTGTQASVESLLKRVFIFLEDGGWSSAQEYCEKVLDIDPENAHAYLGKLMAELRVSSKEGLGKLAEPFDEKANFKKALRYADRTLESELEGYIGAIIKRNKYNADKAVFAEASNIMAQAKTSGDYKKAADKFAIIPDFEHATELYSKCIEKSQIEAKREIYDVAIQCFNSADPQTILMAKGYFSQIHDYEDADVLCAQCDQKAEEARKLKIKKEAEQVLYDQLASFTKMDEAIEALSTISGFRNADELQKKLIERREKQKRDVQILLEKKKKEENQSVVVAGVLLLVGLAIVVGIVFAIYHFAWAKPKEKYDAAIMYYEAGEYQEAINLFSDLKNFKDSEDKLPEVKYAYAERMLYDGDVDGAYLLFSELAGYDESKNQYVSSGYQDARERRIKIIKENPRFAQVGDIVSYGEYEQDNNLDNGKEPIEWFVYSHNGNEILLVSKNALDCRRYHTEERTTADWENSDIRKWLNSDFYSNAFSESQKTQISTSTLKTPGQEEENVTQDAVFLLSKEDCSDENASSFIFESYQITDYARSRVPYGSPAATGMPYEAQYTYHGFWLREPSDQTHAYVRYDALSNSFDSGISARSNYLYAFVRPCIRLVFGE